MKYLIKNQVINADHIVRVQYTSEYSGIDGDSNAPFTCKSSCEITLSSVSIEQDCGYDGSVNGVAATADVITLRGSDADRFWDAYSGDAYQVVTK